ncbi:MAG: SoxR reducing system RseC family protein [Xanthomonadales bacterium]|nr:SoxR reducing system RseC family protein [Xanthomonadales bacterium]
MLEQQGRVVAAGNGEAQVRLGGRSGCSACDAGKGCGAGLFGRLLRRKPMTLHLEDPIGVEPGQAVIVGLPETLFLRLVGRFYLLPLLGGLGGAVAGHYVSYRLGLAAAGSDALTLAGAVLLGVLVYRIGGSQRQEFSEEPAVHLLRAVGVMDKEQEECV